jgi:four helix bundle protein
MNESKSYKDLLIWQKGISIVMATYQLSKTFPKDEEYALSNQIKRAAVSIPSNIAEGYGRNSKKALCYFVNISRGSLYELETQLLIAHKLGFINDLDLYNHLLHLIYEESKMLNSFYNKLTTNN